MYPVLEPVLNGERRVGLGRAGGLYGQLCLGQCLLFLILEDA